MDQVSEVSQSQSAGSRCEACQGPMDLMGLAGGYDVCMDCVKARHRAVLNRRCTCPKSKRRERRVSNGSRTWIACDRCLAQVRQLA